MANDDKWSRWDEYQKTGKWPQTSRQERDAIGKNKKARIFRETLGQGEHPVTKANREIKEQQEREAQNRLF